MLVSHEYGIYTLDAHYLRPGLAACHLIVREGRVALFDTGANNAIPLILDALAGMGLGPEAVDYVIVSHVHLDHAGAAGGLLRVCPNARLVAHPKGAPHMIDPAKLVAGSIAVYGEDNFRRLYGDIPPVPADRVIEAGEGTSLAFAGGQLLFLDTPGHARHHFCMFDAVSQGIFTGDTFGISYREFDVDGRAFIYPTTTPVQFEPEAFHQSIDRLLALSPRAAYLTHFGRVTDLPRLGQALHAQLDEYVALAMAAPEGDTALDCLKQGVEANMLGHLRAHGCRMPESEVRALLANDVELNAQGLLVWLRRGRRGQ